MKFVESFQLRKSEITEEQRFGLISRLFMKALYVAKKKGAKRELILYFIGEKDGLLHFDLVEENSTCLVSDTLQFGSVAINSDGVPMINADGTPVLPTHGKRDWARNRPIDDSPVEWYGEAYPSLEEIDKAKENISVDDKIKMARISQVEVHGVDGSVKLVSLSDFNKSC